MIIFYLTSPCLGQSYYRYLDLTPTMALLPRAEVDSLTASNMVCYRLTSSGDTLDIVRLDRGVPTAAFNFPQGFSVVSTDSSVIWVDADDSSSGYRISLNDNGLPVLLSGLDGNAFLEWVWQSDSEVTTHSIDSTGTRLFTEVLPLFEGNVIRLDKFGELEYFKHEIVLAAGWMYELDNNHRVLNKKAVDSAGEVVSTSDGVFETRYVYDESGNLTLTCFLNVHGDLLPNDYALPRTGNYAFDDNGIVVNEIEIAYTKQIFDQNSLYIVEEFFDVNGDLVENPQGVASVLIERDVYGGISQSTWLDLLGERTEIEGVSVTRRLFNDHGYVIESSTYNAHLNIADFPGGFAYTRFSYTEDGQPELISYYDKFNVPVINTSLGCHARSFIYDLNGLCVELRYLDTTYELVNLATGYARVVSVFDESGNLMEHLFYDQNGVEIFQ